MGILIHLRELNLLNHFAENNSSNLFIIKQDLSVGHYTSRYWLVCSQKLMVGILIHVTKLNLLNPFIVKNCSYLFTKLFSKTFFVGHYTRK